MPQSHHAWVLPVLALAICLPFIGSASADPDLWWHVHTGLRILTNGALPATDDLSFTAHGASWTNHEWLSDVIMATCWKIGGATGLLALRSTLFVLLVTGLVVALQHRLKEPVLVLGFLFATAAVCGVFINVRAHSFTYTMLVWSVVFLDRVRDGDVRYLVPLPLMMLAWVNLHGGFLMGLVLIGSMLAWNLLGTDGASSRPTGRHQQMVVAAGLITLFITVLNPWGPGIYVYLYHELGANHSIISEWQPANGAQLSYLAGFVGIALTFWLLGGRYDRFGMVLILLLVTSSTMKHARFFVMVGLFAPLVAADGLSALLARIRATQPLELIDRALSPKVASALTIVSLLVGVGSFTGAATRQQLGIRIKPQHAPIGSALWLAQNNVGENLAVELKYGGYLIWHLADKYKLSIDGRNLTIYDDEWVDKYLRAWKAGEGEKVLASYQVDAWVVAVDEPQMTALVSQGWEPAFQDDVTAVLVRHSTDLVRGSPQLGSSLLFPGPSMSSTP
jgi:hypothetical protein